MARSLIRGNEPSNTSRSSGPEDTSTRYVFFVCHKGNRDSVNIGSTSEPLKRFSAMQYASETPLEMVGLVVGSQEHMRDVGLYFRDDLMDNGWYSMSPGIEAFIALLPSLSQFIEQGSAPALLQPAPEYMFQLYQIGYTMEEIASFFGRTRQNVHERIKQLTEDRHPRFRDAVGTPIEDSYLSIAAAHPVLTLSSDS